MFENKVSRLELLLKNNPDSKQLQMELHKAVEDLCSNEWILSHFSPYCRNDTDLEPLLQEATVFSPDIGMFATSSHSNIGPRKGVGLSINSSSFNKCAFPKKAKKIGYSQTSFNTSMEMDPYTASSRKSSANPLFRASESLSRFMSPEFCTMHNSYYGASDLENGYSPCWNSTEMSLYEQKITDPFLAPEAIDTNSKEILECETSIYSSASYATQSINCDEYERDMNAHRYKASYSYLETPQEDMKDKNGLTACSSFQPLNKDLRKSVIKLEPQPGAATDENMEQEDRGSDADSFILKEEAEMPSVCASLVPKVDPEAPSTNEATGTPPLDARHFEQRDSQLSSAYSTEPEATDSAMVDVSEFDLPSDRSGPRHTKLDSYPTQVLDHSEVEEQESRMLTEGQETSHGDWQSTMEDEEYTRVTGEKGDNEGYSTQGMRIEEEDLSSSGEKLYQPSDNSSSVREPTNLSNWNLVNEIDHNRNQKAIEANDVGARGAQGYTPGKTDIESKVAESTANTSAALTDTSASSRSESSNQSTPRSLVTTSISELADSLNSKSSTITDVSDDESSDNSDKTELEGESAQHNKGITHPLGSQRMRTESILANWPNLPPAIEDSSSRLSQLAPMASANEIQSNVALQGLHLHGSNFTSLPQEHMGSQQFSVSRLPIAEMRSLDSRISVLEDRTPSQGSSMASRSISRIPAGRVGWDYKEENIPRESS